MATDITIKRYNGSTWEELAPKTTKEQVEGLQSALDAKQDKSNLVTSVSSSSTDTQYPSAKLFYDTTQSIMETAEGKTASYVSGVYKDSNDRYYLAVGAVGSSPVASGTPVTSPEVTKIEINSSTSSVDITQYQYLYILDSTGNNVLKSIDILDFKSGDVLLLIPTNLPDFWFNATENDTVLYKLETTKVDLSDYVTIDTSQTITGVKTFNNDMTVIGNINIIHSGAVPGEGLKINVAGGGFTKYTDTAITIDDTKVFGLPSSKSNGTYTLATTDDIAYPTTFSWTAGTSAGPTGTLSGTNMSPVSFGAIPSASMTQSGIVTTDAQTFTGAKQFGTTTTFQVNARFRNGNNDSYSTVEGNSSSASNITLTLPASSGTLSLMQTYLQPSQPSDAHTGDIWYQTAA